MQEKPFRISYVYDISIGEKQIDLELMKERGTKLKSIGVVRKVDELGRIVMPIELRRALDIAIKDSMEFFIDGDKIVLKNISQRASA